MAREKPRKFVRLAASLALLAWGSAFFTSACPGLGEDELVSSFQLPEQPTWANSIRQLLAAYCIDCHGERPADPSVGYFRVDTYDDRDGRLGAYSLRHRHLARVSDASRPMPPAPARTMTPDEVEALRRWVELGGPLDETDLTESSRVLTCQPGVVGACACPGGWYGHQECLDDGTFAPCQCGVDPDGTGPSGDPPQEPVLADVVEWVLGPSCSRTAGCHGAVGALPDLTDDGGLMARLLAPSAQAPEMRRVEPGFPDQSYLFLKTRADFSSLGVGSGGRMPPDAGLLSQEQVGVLQRWIENGAPE